MGNEKEDADEEKEKEREREAAREVGSRGGEERRQRLCECVITPLGLGSSRLPWIDFESMRLFGCMRVHEK